jgi:nucleotide-binding universal stress UspA family protein
VQLLAAMSEHREPGLMPRVRRYRIVVGIDLSEYSDIVLEHSLDQAARHDAPELHLLTVRERRKPSAEDVKQALWERVYPSLEAFNRHGRDWRARLHVRRGKPDEQIAQLAGEVRADLIVIGTFGLHHGSSSKNLPNRVVQAAGCPTLVIGMPETIDSKQCPVCVAIREGSEGEQWFCEDHSDSGRKTQHAMSPMTVWTGGMYAIERAA